MTPVVPALAGALVVTGLIGMVAAARPTAVVPAPMHTISPLAWIGARFTGLDARTRVLLAAGAGAGVGVAALTGWVIAVALVPAALAGVPLLLTAPGSAGAAGSIERLEALEEWTRSLSGKLTAGQSLRSALIKSLASAPQPIEAEVRLMVSRLWNNTVSTEQVLRAFAEDLDDSTGDVVASQLILAATGRGQAGLARSLEALAETVAAEVRARRQIAADQAKPRTTARTVTVITLGVLGVLGLSGDYIQPYATALGQLVLAVLLTAYVAILVMLRRMAVAAPLPRFLSLPERTARRAGAGGSW